MKAYFFPDATGTMNFIISIRKQLVRFHCEMHAILEEVSLFSILLDEIPEKLVHIEELATECLRHIASLFAVLLDAPIQFAAFNVARILTQLVPFVDDRRGR